MAAVPEAGAVDTSAALAGGMLVPSPSVERGQPLRLAVSPDGSTVGYPALKLVVLRSIEDPTRATIFRGHISPVRCVAFSRDGEWVASGDKSGVVQVWKVSDPTVVRSKGAASVDLRDVAFDPSGDNIVVCGDDKKANILNVEKLMTICPEIMPMDKVALSCDWSPAGGDGSSPQATAWGGEDQRVFVYAKSSTKGFTQTKILSEADNFINCVRFSPSGDRVATVSSDKGVRVYDVGAGDADGYTFVKQLGTAKGRHKGSVYTCSWSPDGKDLITASADKTCKVWNMEENKIRRTITMGTTRQHMVNAAAFAGADKYVAATLGGALHIGDPTVKEAPPAVLGHCSQITAVAYDSTSQRMLTCDTTGTVLVWTAAGDRAKRNWSPAAVTGEIAPHEKFVTCGDASGGVWVTGSNDNELHIGTTEPAQRNFKVDIGRLPPRKVAVHPTIPKIIACVTMDEVIAVCDGEIIQREAIEEPISMAFDADGRHLYVGRKDGQVLCYECADGALNKTLDVAAVGRGDYAASLLVIPGGVLVVGTSNRDVILLDASDLSTKLSRKWIEHSGSVKALGYLEEEEQLATVCGSGMLCLWELGKDKPLLSLRRPLGSSIEGLAIVDGCSAWALSDGVVQCVDTEVEG